MKKILFAVLLSFILIPLSINAEECTDEMVALYLPQANNVYMQSVVTSNPDTYKIYVYGLSDGISYDGINGTEFSDGYYAFASAGDTFTISVKVSDGSACALRTIKAVSISLPANTTVTQPTVEPTTPTTDTNTSNNTQTGDTNTSSSGTSSNNTPPDNPISNSDASISDSDKVDENSVDKNIDEQTIETDEQNNDVEEELTTTSAPSKKDNSIIKYIIISISIIVMVGTAVLIYFKKIKRHKK